MGEFFGFGARGRGGVVGWLSGVWVGFGDGVWEIGVGVLG